MKMDILLRTRDYDRDYRWIFKPDYIDQVTENKMSFLIQMMQQSEKRAYLTEEGCHNIYFIYDENGSALVRSGFTGSMDRQGRNIYSVEGVACPPEMNRLFWYSLPYLVDWFSRQPMLGEQWIHETDGEVTEDGSRQINIEGLTEAAILAGWDEPDNLWHKIQDQSVCMQRLYEDIMYSSNMFSFVYGTRAKTFYENTHLRCYTPEAVNHLEPVVLPDTIVAPYPVIPKADASYMVEIQIEKRNRRYGAYLRAIDHFGEALAETEDMSFGQEGISVMQIERAVLALDKKMQALGYVRGREAKT